MSRRCGAAAWSVRCLSGAVPGCEGTMGVGAAGCNGGSGGPPIGVYRIAASRLGFATAASAAVRASGQAAVAEASAPSRTPPGLRRRSRRRRRPTSRAWPAPPRGSRVGRAAATSSRIGQSLSASASALAAVAARQRAAVRSSGGTGSPVRTRHARQTATSIAFPAFWASPTTAAATARSCRPTPVPSKRVISSGRAAAGVGAVDDGADLGDRALGDQAGGDGVLGLADRHRLGDLVGEDGGLRRAARPRPPACPWCRCPCRRGGCRA